MREILIICLLLGPVLPASANPHSVRLSWSQTDATRSMTVTWTTDSAADPSSVLYGVGEATEEATGESFTGNESLGVIHSVELTDLEPDTEYQYLVGGNGDWTGPFHFRTPSDEICAPLRFVAIGDNRPDTDYLPQIHWNPILTEAAEVEPLLFVHTGDLVKSGDETDQWNTFFSSADPVFSYIPIMAAMGNHDDGPGQGDTANYNQVFSFPRNQETMTEDFYFFTTGNAIFVSISTQTFSEGENPFQVQADWLDSVLTENQRPWKFVFLHHPPYTSHQKFDLGFWDFEFNHEPNENGQNQALVPVFDKHHVDIVFAGHNHYYERFSPLAGGGGDNEGKLAASFAEGTVYVITGGAGAFTYDEFDIFGVELDLIDWVCGSAVGSTACSGKHHYVSIDINGPVLTYEAWSTAEQNFGRSQDYVELLDTFQIIKTDFPSCETDPPPEPQPEIVEPPPVADIVEASPESPPEVISPPPESPKTEIMTAADTPQAPETASPETVAPADGKPEEPGDTSSSGCSCRLAEKQRFPISWYSIIFLMSAVFLALRRRKPESQD